MRMSGARIIPPLKTVQAELKRKGSITTREFLKYLESYLKPSIGSRRRTPRNNNELNSIADKVNKNSSLSYITPSQQENIVTSIENEIFGNPMPESIAVIIAKNLRSFTYSNYQSKIATAIKQGKFGDPMQEIVAESLASNLGGFMEKNSKSIIATAIKEGKFGDPMSKVVAKSLAGNLGCFTEKNSQSIIASAIKEGKFGDPMSKVVAETILDKLGTFTELVQIGVFEDYAKGNFGTSSKTVFQNTTRNKLNDLREVKNQLWVARAIQVGVFGDNIPVSDAKTIANNLGAFTDPVAQVSIASAIQNGKFGDPMGEVIAKTIAGNLGAFTDPFSQSLVAKAIQKGKFGKPMPESIAVITAKNFSVFKYPNSQSEIAAAIKEGVFGKPIPITVAKNIADNLEGFVNHKDNIKIFKAIQQSHFETPIIRHLVDKIISNMSLDVFRSLHSELITIYPNSLDLKYNDLEKFDPDIFYETKASDHNPLEEVLKSPMGRYVITVDDSVSPARGTIQTSQIQSLLGVEHLYMFDDNKPYTMTVYEKGSNKYLLIYKLQERDDQVDSAGFKGWLSEYWSTYISAVSNVKILELSGEFPKLLDIKDKHHSDFMNLPRFMQLAIDNASFNVSDYTHKVEFNFLFSILDTLKEEQTENAKKALVDKMRSIIQTCIAQMGDEVRLSSDVAEDKKIKDAINSLYESQDLMESLILDPSYKTKLETFLHGKGDLQKLKLAFLFGQLAKRGVLGYEHGTSNRANTLFYQLSYACYQSVSVKSGGLEEFEDLYRDGECIEAISNGIMVRARRSQPEFLQSIWKRNSNT